MLVPMLLGLVMIVLTHAALDEPTRKYFELVNIRMIATTSSALDTCNEYFSYHPLTYFLSHLVPETLTRCPYQDQLSVVMQNTYGSGYQCLAVRHRRRDVSRAFFRAADGACCWCPIGLQPHVLLNVPLTVAMLTHGTAFLFLLWYVTPRTSLRGKR